MTVRELQNTCLSARDTQMTHQQFWTEQSDLRRPHNHSARAPCSRHATVLSLGITLSRITRLHSERNKCMGIARLRAGSQRSPALARALLDLTTDRPLDDWHPRLGP